MSREPTAHPSPARPDALLVTVALRDGIATLDALAARTAADREMLLWALDEAVELGWVAASGPGCGPDGLCGASPPTVYSVTEAGRRASAGG